MSKRIKRAVRLRATRVQYLQIRNIYDNVSIPLKPGHTCFADLGDFLLLELGDDVCEITGTADDTCEFLDVVLREVYGMSYEEVLNPDHDEWHPIISDHMSFEVTARQKHSSKRS